MSYSLESNCHNCKKGGFTEGKCLDGEVLQGAINTIQYIGQERGHLGFGNVKLECSGFEQKEPENQP